MKIFAIGGVLMLLGPLGSAIAMAQGTDHPVVIAGFTYVPGQAGVFGFGQEAAVPIVIQQGDTVTATNFDPDTHTVTSDECVDPELPCPSAGNPRLFDSSIIDVLETRGTPVSELPPGSYPFFCRVHPFMHGLLVVTE
ncbi:MAG: cupredoxin domain-containing protein [Candidatus Binatia bacterium]